MSALKPKENAGLRFDDPPPARTPSCSFVFSNKINTFLHFFPFFFPPSSAVQVKRRVVDAEQSVSAAKERLNQLEGEASEARRALDEVRAVQRSTVNEAEGILKRSQAAAAAAEQRCEAAKRCVTWHGRRSYIK